MTQTAFVVGSIAASFLATFGFLLYAFNDIDKEQKRRTLGIMLHINITLAVLEKRLSTGQLRTAQELDAEIERYTKRVMEEVSTP
jgi:hypothetical protein